MISLKQRLQDLVNRISDEFNSIRVVNSTTNLKIDNFISQSNNINNKIEVMTASSNWILNHTLGRAPIVSIYLDTGEQVITDVYSSNTQINVIFPEPKTGFVILK